MQIWIFLAALVGAMRINFLKFLTISFYDANGKGES